MKKLLGILALCIITSFCMIGLAGCGNNDNPYAELDLNEYLKVGDYKGIETKEVKVEVEKSELADAINEALDAAAEQKDLEKGTKVEKGDTVNINYVGKVDGKTFEGGSAKKQDLDLGSGTFIDGFEDGLIGHTVGEKDIELNLAFPVDYSEKSLQGKDVVFTVKINSAKRTVEPEYNDEFVKTQGDYKNTDEYEKALMKKLKKEKKAEALEDQKNEIWSTALENTEVKKYPKDIVKHYIDTYDAQLDYVAEQYGTSREAVMQQYYGITDEKTLKKQFKDSARLLVKQEMLIEYIAEKEGIEYTKEEAEKLQADIEAQGYDEETVESQTGRTMEQYLRIELLFEKVQDFLLENAKVVK